MNNTPLYRLNVLVHKTSGTPAGLQRTLARRMSSSMPMFRFQKYLLMGSYKACIIYFYFLKLLCVLWLFLSFLIEFGLDIFLSCLIVFLGDFIVHLRIVSTGSTWCSSRYIFLVLIVSVHLLVVLSWMYLQFYSDFSVLSFLVSYIVLAYQLLSLLYSTLFF